MSATQFGPEAFQSRTSVSRETLRQFEIYADLLKKWQSSINLIGPESLPDLWWRHFYDSAQLAPHITEAGPLIDLGSGGGFPGLVLALLGRDDVTLVESNGKKCVFLREVARSTGVNVTIIQDRIEVVTDIPRARWVTSRALASLDNLLSYAHPLLAPEGQCLFLKGRKGRAELTEAQKNWNMRVDTAPSQTDPEGVIFTIGDLEPHHDEPLTE